MAIEFLCNIWKVEHGSAAFVRTPSGKCHLLDAGCSDSFSPSDYLSSQWGMGAVDCLVVSHPHNDHIQDLPNIIKNFKPKVLVRNKSTPADLVYPSGDGNLCEPMASWKKICSSHVHPVAEDNNIRSKTTQGGVVFKFFSLCREQLPSSAQDNINNYSLVTCINYKGLELIFPGDLEPPAWDALMTHTDFGKFAGTGDWRFLIAPHHGRSSGIRYQDNTLCKAVLDTINPHAVIISDKRGSRSTDPEAYRGYCLGIDVSVGEELVTKKVITTKSNECVSIQVEDDSFRVKLF
jgi:competence protein ComEC